MRMLWGSIRQRWRFFDQAADGSAEQQVPAGPSDPGGLENV
jgi:hypothetical protein